MKPERRQRVTPNPVPAPNWREPLQRWGNTALTVALVIVIGFLVIRWRAVHAAQARLGVLSQLAGAQTLVQSLAVENPNRPVASLAQARVAILSAASDALAGVLNGTDDDKLRAQSLVTRGDLYWHLANLPPLPGATTQPSLQLPSPPEQALDRSAQSYQEALDSYPSQHEQAIAARFGLAAVAENRRDWPAAQKQLQAILDDPSAEPALHDQAQRELTVLPTLDKPLYFATSQPADLTTSSASTTAVAQPASMPAVSPLPQPEITLPMDLNLPTTMPMPASTGPAAPAVVQPATHPTR